MHPQKWTDDIDYADKKVVVIGSGATAVTIVPALATKAEQVTMLQRSPTYMVSRPAEDKIANFLRAVAFARRLCDNTLEKCAVGNVFLRSFAEASVGDERTYCQRREEKSR